jgi:hypothetical protein
MKNKTLIAATLLLSITSSLSSAFALDVRSSRPQENGANKKFVDVSWVKDESGSPRIKFQYCENNQCSLMGTRAYSPEELEYAAGVLRKQAYGVIAAEGVAGLLLGAAGAAAAVGAAAGTGITATLGAAGAGVGGGVVGAFAGIKIPDALNFEALDAGERFRVAASAEKRFTNPDSDAVVSESIETYRDRLNKVLNWISKKLGK